MSMKKNKKKVKLSFLVFCGGAERKHAVVRICKSKL